MNDDRRPSRRRFALPALCVLTCLATTGCGSYGSVSGKISYKGEPLTGGTVLFFPGSAGAVSSVIGPDGGYKVDNVPAGPVTIAVETKSAQPFSPPDKAPTADAAPKTAALPDAYSDPKGSGLTYTVKAGPQTHDIDLK